MDGERPLKFPPDSASTFTVFFNSDLFGSAIRLKAFQKRFQENKKQIPIKVNSSLEEDEKQQVFKKDN